LAVIIIKMFFVLSTQFIYYQCNIAVVKQALLITKIELYAYKKVFKTSLSCKKYSGYKRQVLPNASANEYSNPILLAKYRSLIKVLRPKDNLQVFDNLKFNNYFQFSNGHFASRASVPKHLNISS